MSSKIEQLADDYQRAHRDALAAADEMMAAAKGSVEYDRAVNTWRARGEAEELAKKELILRALAFGSR